MHRIWNFSSQQASGDMTPADIAAAIDHEQQAHKVGTPEYRARHIAMLWSPSCWAEAIGVGACVALMVGGFFGLILATNGLGGQ